MKTLKYPVTKEDWEAFCVELEKGLNEPVEPPAIEFYSQEAYDAYQKVLESYLKENNVKIKKTSVTLRANNYK